KQPPKKRSKAPKANPPAIEAPVSRPQPLRLGLSGPKRDPGSATWRLENVPAPNSAGSYSGARALALAAPLQNERRLEFGVARLAPTGPLATSSTNLSSDIGVQPRSQTRSTLPGAQVYVRLNW